MEEQTKPKRPSPTEQTSPTTDGSTAVFYSLIMFAVLLLAILFFSLFNLQDPTIALTHISLINSTHNASLSFCLSVSNPSNFADLRYRENSIVVHFLAKTWPQQDVAFMLPAEARVVEGGSSEVLCMKNNVSGLTQSSGFGGPGGLVHIATWARLDGGLQVYGFIPLTVRAYAYCWSALSSLNSTTTKVGTSIAIRCTAY